MSMQNFKLFRDRKLGFLKPKSLKLFLVTLISLRGGLSQLGVVLVVIVFGFGCLEDPISASMHAKVVDALMNGTSITPIIA